MTPYGNKRFYANYPRKAINREKQLGLYDDMLEGWDNKKAARQAAKKDILQQLLEMEED